MDKLDDCILEITNLFTKYKTNPIICDKLYMTITNLKENIEKSIIEIEEKQKKENEQIIFTNQFLQEYKYYYCSTTDLFFYYDDIHYVLYNEDHIIHKILTTITLNHPHLMRFKQKLKYLIIKKIKTMSPLHSIPESITIQSVLNNIYPTLFNEKIHAKYFLTVMGDILLKKSSGLIYIISPDMKNILNDLLCHTIKYVGQSNLLNSIKYKYYDYNFEDCRFIASNNLLNKHNFDDSLNIMDLLCVATHYSIRYNSSDLYLTHYDNIELNDYVWFLKNNTLDTIVNEFINTSLENCNGVNISWKNMQYIWKQYVYSKKLSSIYNLKLKNSLIEKLNYENDVFFNLTSKELPLVSNFILFWDKNITPSEDEYEIDELLFLFKKFMNKTILNLSDKILIELIQHYYPDIIIEENKYVQNISCLLWNKQQGIIDVLNYLKKNGEEYKNMNELYKYYCKFYSNKNYIVCKKYFEKFINISNVGHN